MFGLRSSTHFLRGHNMLCLPKSLTTSYGIISFSYLAAISWNSLPDHHRTISDFFFFSMTDIYWKQMILYFLNFVPRVFSLH